MKQKYFTRISITLALIISPLLLALLIDNNGLSSQLLHRNMQPSLQHLFGTDWLGRDMLTRTIFGLVKSIGVGFIASIFSGIIAALLAITAVSCGKQVDRCVTWLIDVFLSVPHLVLLLLIAFIMGGGAAGVIIAVALTHWPSLARLIRSEILAVRSSDYILISRAMGKSNWWIATRHMIPLILPQFLVGTLLLFPHAILHEAAITFLGMGLSPHQPAIGIILSESMKHLSTGLWWLALFPGLSLFIVVFAVDIAAKSLFELHKLKRGK